MIVQFVSYECRRYGQGGPINHVVERLYVRCIVANAMRDIDKQLCPFCRTPAPTEKERIQRVKKRVHADDAEAVYNFGSFFYQGSYGYPITSKPC